MIVLLYFAWVWGGFIYIPLLFTIVVRAGILFCVVRSPFLVAFLWMFILGVCFLLTD